VGNSYAQITDNLASWIRRQHHVRKRETLAKWAESKGGAALAAYQAEHNCVSLDGLPGLRSAEEAKAATHS
jgi:hypothetical protein